MSYGDRSELDDRGQVTRAEVAKLLESERRLFVRLAIDVGNSPANVLRAEFTAGVESACDDPDVWDYGSLLLVAEWIDGTDAGAWITSGSGELQVAGRGTVAFRLPDLQDTGTWSRLPAHAGNDTPPLDSPYRRFTFNVKNGITAPHGQQTWYVCPERPSFPSVDTAIQRFFSHTAKVSEPPNRSEVLTVRVAERGPRIARVRFTPGEVVVAVDGLPAESHGQPLRVEFDAGGHRSNTDLSAEPWEAAFPLGPDHEGEWWAVLSEGNRWLDYRRSSALWQPSPGVEIEPPVLSAEEELDAILAFGERTTAEFKQQLPTTQEGKRKLCRTVAAFANGLGGTILFGILKDEATIVGIEESFADARDRLTDIVTSNLTATPPFEARKFVTDAGLVVGLFVEPGDDTPYGVDKQSPRYFIRINATTLPASPEHVRRFVQSRSSQLSYAGHRVM